MGVGIFASYPLTPKENPPGTHYLGVEVVHRAGLYVMEERNISNPNLESNPYSYNIS
jgi:hypothetical protein